MDDFTISDDVTVFKNSTNFLDLHEDTISKHYLPLFDYEYFWYYVERCNRRRYEMILYSHVFDILMSYDYFNEYVTQMKQKELDGIDVPFCVTVFDDFVNENYNYNYNYYSVYSLYFDYVIFDKYGVMYPMTICAMIYDKEFAYTQFYKFGGLQEFEPFVEHKKNYNERKERLLVVYEEIYGNYENGNDVMEMAFSNEYLIMAIARFL